jgi:hypothetical protein
VGQPAASKSTLAPGAGHGGEGDASLQGPAQEKDQDKDQAQLDTLPEQPKPTNASADVSEDAPSSIIALRTATREARETNAAPHDTSGLVMTRPKPEKRKNAKERAKDRLEKRKGKTATADVAEVAAIVPAVSGLSTAHPKPERRKNAKERAQEKFKVKPAEDGTTPDMTAKAKSKADLKKADLKKAERKKAKADRKAKRSAASKAA